MALKLTLPALSAAQVRLGESPPPTPVGYSLHSVPEGTEVLLKPRMFYELQRGVKKLRF